MSNRSKGQTRERMAQEMLERSGWLVYRVKGSTKFNRNVDIFGLFDLLCIRKQIVGQERLWIQVKTRDKPPLEPYYEFKEKYCDDHDSVELWVWKKRKGFDIFKL